MVKCKMATWDDSNWNLTNCFPVRPRRKPVVDLVDEAVARDGHDARVLFCEVDAILDKFLRVTGMRRLHDLIG